LNARAERKLAEILRSIGNTPLIELTELEQLPRGVRLFGKLEAQNPGGSIKDRPVSRMLAGALRAGRIANGVRVLDSSSGNAGIAYAWIGSALSIPVTLVVPANASRERLDRIASHGAELLLTDPIEGYDFTLREARRLADAHPDRYWYANQYENDDNWRAHYESTGAEILKQLAERGCDPPGAFVAGVGTGGALTGVARRLREARSDLHVTAVIPEVFPGIEGLKPLGEPQDIVPAILDPSLIDQRRPIGLEESLDLCRRLARAGLFVGPSSGAYVAVALERARSGEHAVLVTLLNDTGERYGSTGMWQR
jgi:cysteine synthase B